MKRTAINPNEWSIPFGFNQGELVEGQQKILFCSGQTAIDDDGKTQHAGDFRAQTLLALDNLKAVLAKADMSLADVVRLTVYTTDVEQALANFDVLAGALQEAGVRPAQTLLGVAALAFPELMIEIEATAVG